MASSLNSTEIEGNGPICRQEALRRQCAAGGASGPGGRVATGIPGSGYSSFEEDPMATGGFKQFLLRGNVVDLAVGVVVGAAFGGVVTALTKDLLTPLIAAVVGKPDFSAIQFTVNNSKFLIGDLANAVVSFVLIAAAVYYIVVLPVNALVSRAHREPPADPTTMKCPQCLSEIPIGAKRCGFCTSQLVSSAGSVD